eukprot:COSAG06_NODE_657_length_13324_cov_11.730380_3_plen_107_part_00
MRGQDGSVARRPRRLRLAVLLAVAAAVALGRLGHGQGLCFLSLFLWGGFLGFFGGPFLVTLLHHATRGRWSAALLCRSGFRLHGFRAGAKQVGVSRSIVVVVLVGF